MKETVLFNSLKELRDTNEDKLQLDIFHENGQVLIQIFNQRDMLNWDESVKIINFDGVVIEVLFSDNKKGNHENIKRFQNLENYQDWILRDHSLGKFYYMGFRSSIELVVIYRTLMELLEFVYEIDNYYFTLNAY